MPSNRLATAAFMLLLQNQNLTDLRAAIDYCIILRRLAYAGSTKDARVVCVCSGDQSANLSMLQKWMEVETDKVIDETSWSLGGKRVVAMTEISRLFHIGRLEAARECIVIIDASSTARLPPPTVIQRAIAAVTADHHLLVVPKPRRSGDLPNWGVLSFLTLMTCGVGMTAASAMMISCKKGWLRGTRYYREQRGYTDELSYNVPWLLGAIAFEYQRGRDYISLHVEHV